MLQHQLHVLVIFLMIARTSTARIVIEARIVIVEEFPHVCLFATTDIDIGSELRYNYGDGSKKLWWRKEVKFIN